jgi:hypothetical protein
MWVCGTGTMMLPEYWYKLKGRTLNATQMASRAKFNIFLHFFCDILTQWMSRNSEPTFIAIVISFSS